MKLTWHILAKDLRRHWPLLTLWFVLFVLRIFLCSRLVQAAGWEPNRFTQQGMNVGAVTFLLGVINYLLVCALMLEDPVTGSRMFWATRPIAGGRLLVAKALAVVLVFLLGPMLINLAWGLGTGIAPIDLLPSLGRTLFFHAAVTIPAMALAALSGTVSRVFVWSLLAVVAIPLVAATAPPLFSDDAREVRVSLVLGCLALGSVGAIGCLFLIRRLVMATAWMLASIALALGAAFFCRWAPVSPPQEVSAGGPRFEAKEISINLQNDHAVVELTLAVTGVPPDFMMRRGILRAELTWPNGDITWATGRLEVWPSDETLAYSVLGLPEKPPLDPETEAHFQAMRSRGARPEAVAAEAGNWRMPSRSAATVRTCNAFFFVSSREFQRLMNHPPRCRVWLAGPKLRPHLIGEVPLQSGAGLSTQGFHLAIQEAKKGEVAIIGMRSASAAYEKKPTCLSCAFTYSQPAVSSGQILEFRILDRPRGRVLSANDGRSSPLLTVFGLPSDYFIRWMTLSPPQVWRTDHMVELPEAYEDFTVAAVALRPVGQWVQSFEIERLAPTPRTSASQPVGEVVVR